MKRAATLAGLILLGLAAPASAALQQERAITTAPSTGALVLDIRRAVADARQQALADGLTGEALEMRVGAAIEGVIATSGADPSQVLEAVRLAIAQEQCLADDVGRWNRLGCAALDRVQQAVASVVGGPAAIGGPGSPPTGTFSPPPGATAGPDYEND